MTFRHLTAATALAAGAALLLTGCGGGDDSKPASKDKISGADKAEKSPSPDASSEDGRPAISLPKDDVLVFEGGKTGNPQKDAVLKDNEERHRAVDAAIIKGDPKFEPVYYYSTGDAAISASKWITSVVNDGYSVTGKVRFFDREVTIRKDGSARLTYCSDESKWFGKDRKTGKVDKTPVTAKSYVFYDTRLDRNDKGVWQTSAVTSTRGADQCQP